jgi:hypothetical protein
MHCVLPSLATADAEQLVYGLQQGHFHSIDLVNVSRVQCRRRGCGRD